MNKTITLSQKSPKGIPKEDIILFVHGAWHGAWCWEKYFMEHFAARGYQSYALTLRKHDVAGKTKGINGLSINDYVEDLKAVVKKLEQPPIIIAHSMGGLLLQKYLETETCKKAVLMASVPPTGVLRTTLNFLKKPYAYPSLLTMNLYGLVDTPSKAKWAFFSNTLEDNLTKAFCDNLCSESYRAFINMLYPNIKVNHHVKIPLLVIGAANDNIFSVEENKQTAKKYNAPLIILPNMAHDMMLDTHHVVAANRIMDWIESV